MAAMAKNDRSIRPRHKIGIIGLLAVAPDIAQKKLGIMFCIGAKISAQDAPFGVGILTSAEVRGVPGEEASLANQSSAGAATRSATSHFVC